MNIAKATLIIGFMLMAALNANSQTRGKNDEVQKRIEASDKNRHSFVSGSWHYDYYTAAGKTVKISRYRIAGADLIAQSFYLSKDKLIYVIETIGHDAAPPNDYPIWKGIFWFYNGKMIDQEITGQGRPDNDRARLEKEVLAHFKEVSDEVSKK